MMKHGLAVLASAASLATAFTGGSCSSGSTCALDSSGYYVCDTFASAYPYDYAYYDPYYATSWGYYPYYVDTYYDPYGYTYVYQASSLPSSRRSPPRTRRWAATCPSCSTRHTVPPTPSTSGCVPRSIRSRS